MSEAIAGELTCSICLELYDDPRILSCHHSFCKQCLLDIFLNKTTAKCIVCPNCREKLPVKSENDVDNLPKNFTLANITEKYKESQKEKDIVVPCDICETNPPTRATKTCIQCSISYCETCLTQLHPKRGVLAKHTFIDAALKGSISPNHEETTKTTGTTKSYCEDCNVLLGMSDVSQHASHSVKSIDEAYDTKQILLESYEVELQDLLKTTEKNQSLVQAAIETERENAVIAEDELSDVIKNIKAGLDQKQKAVVLKMRETLTSSIAEKQSQQAELQQHHREIESSLANLQLLSALVDKGSFLQMSKDLLTALQDRFQRTVEVSPNLMKAFDYQKLVEEVKTDGTHAQMASGAQKRGTLEDRERVHEGVLCDGCDSELYGNRYKCMKCPDYDLCEDCMGVVQHSCPFMMKMTFCYNPTAPNKQGKTDTMGRIKCGKARVLGSRKPQKRSKVCKDQESGDSRTSKHDHATSTHGNSGNSLLKILQQFQSDEVSDSDGVNTDSPAPDGNSNTENDTNPARDGNNPTGNGFNNQTTDLSQTATHSIGSNHPVASFNHPYGQPQSYPSQQTYPGQLYPRPEYYPGLVYPPQQLPYPSYPSNSYPQ